jgi:hypothetical protein
MVLKQLCAGRYLMNHVIDAMPDEMGCAHIAGLHVFEQETMGKDCIRKVFTMNQSAEKYGTAGDTK